MMYNTVIDFKEVIMTPFKDEIAKNLLYYRKSWTYAETAGRNAWCKKFFRVKLGDRTKLH